MAKVLIFLQSGKGSNSENGESVCHDSCKKLKNSRNHPYHFDFFTGGKGIIPEYYCCDKFRCINISVKRFALLLGLASRGEMLSYTGTAVPARWIFPFYSRRGAGRRGSNIKHQNSLWKTTIINDIRIKDHFIHNLLENSELTGFARIGFGIAIELDGDSHNERLTITFNGTINIKKELGCLYYYPGLRPPLLKKKGSIRDRTCRA